MKAPPPEGRLGRGLAWLWLSLFVTAALHWTAGITTALSIRLMSSTTPFALEVRAFELTIVPYYRVVAYAAVLTFILWWAWPVVRHVRGAGGAPVEKTVRERAVAFPAMVGLASLAPWVFSTVFYPTVAYFRFGRWSTELVSQEILSPLVNGFLAATTSYLFVDWIFRASVIPQLFPDGRASGVRGTLVLGLRSRFLVFLAAVAFIPMFTMLGLARTAQVRWEGGADPAAVLHGLAEGSTAVFFVYAFLGIVLTLALARTFTRPLAEIVEGLERVEEGDVSVAVRVESADELGRLQEGLNSMVSGLREKNRIFDAFGRVVEPQVRDRLLGGGVERAGERRHAAVLFCDLRGFTRRSETAEPEEVVEFLNEFFSSVSRRVREHGGFVDKFIGDAALAVFGLFDEERAEHEATGAAVRCALAMLEAPGDGPSSSRVFDVTMAVHSGPVLAGAIGAADRHEYTVIGDTVNVAARLQGLAKEKNSVLALSRRAYEEAVRAGVPVSVDGEGTAELRGRREPVAYVLCNGAPEPAAALSRT